ncbi:MAG: hypothetical protein ABFD44_15105 [Anaerolineaceae bacterium]
MKKDQSFLPVFFSLAALYLFRRWGQRWGATDTEVDQSLPADELVPHPMVETTHAITIRTRPERVWQWIVQMGYYRGGWYTDTEWWDYLPDRYFRLLVREETRQSGYHHRDEPSASRILPEYQDLKVGDVILDGPPGTTFFTVAALETNRLLALYSTTHPCYLFPRSIRENPKLGIAGEFCWNFILQEIDDGHTRLILRTRLNVQPMLFRVFADAFLPMVDWALARKMLTGIKKRAEQVDP